MEEGEGRTLRCAIRFLLVPPNKDISGEQTFPFPQWSASAVLHHYSDGSHIASRFRLKLNTT